MLTKARIAGHPIHPMLIAFPVAMYVATAVALIVYGGTQDLFWYRAAFWTNLSGVVMAAVAALPGLIDFVGLPAKSKARGTGIRHAALNVVALAAFVISVILIGESLFGTSPDISYAAPLVLSLAGVVVTVGAGWFGWKMVQTHHVGVKPTAQAAAASYDRVDDLDAVVVTPPTSYPAKGGNYPMTH